MIFELRHGPSKATMERPQNHSTKPLHSLYLPLHRLPGGNGESPPFLILANFLCQTASSKSKTIGLKLAHGPSPLLPHTISRHTLPHRQVICPLRSFIKQRCHTKFDMLSHRPRLLPPYQKHMYRIVRLRGLGARAMRPVVMSILRFLDISCSHNTLLMNIPIIISINNKLMEQ